MQVMVDIDPEYVIQKDLFDSEDKIAARVLSAPVENQTAFRKTLRYLYISHGPTNLLRDDLKAALCQLTISEQKVVKWLQIRTNGSLRRTYGKDALRAARTAKYRCVQCGFADVRVLNLDHVERRSVSTSFRCLCANCHHIKSCQLDWSGSAAVDGVNRQAPATSFCRDQAAGLDSDQWRAKTTSEPPARGGLSQ